MEETTRKNFLPKSENEFKIGLKPLSEKAIALKDASVRIVSQKLGIKDQALITGASQQYNRTVTAYGYLMAFAEE